MKKLIVKNAVISSISIPHTTYYLGDGLARFMPLGGGGTFVLEGNFKPDISPEEKEIIIEDRDTGLKFKASGYVKCFETTTDENLRLTVITTKPWVQIISH